MILDQLSQPIVQAPMAGGVSTPALAAAVSNAGGLGFLAAGYRTADAVREQIATTRTLTAEPFGINIFVPDTSTVDGEALATYRERLAAEARRYRVELADPADDDDAWAAKLALVQEEQVPVVSFTFGCPDPTVLTELREAGCTTVVTVTSAGEALTAAAAGADALCVQGTEAGGHRGTFHNTDPVDDTALLPLLRKVSAAVTVPLIAAGGLSGGRDVAAVLVAGARAAQLGTMFLACPEAGTNPVHRASLPGDRPTAVTRAFTGRPARGLVNRFLVEHTAAAPAAYPHIHHLTKVLRQAGDPEAMSLWAGQAHEFARTAPAADVVRDLGAGARAALTETALRWSAG
ncbi:2-nitropropane dioxygenase [Actinophytocola xinjiangensis]|uniref:Probable nitronate monooxygenase n=1 Tax=Actinophytocola xinjiangensis TaxID=485602 RepID=A0A7Z1AZT3_9PSEU|nr:nitronate monooxygenase [Actinophytocola xinjiangensis]OLF11104.1 2-nitropropane dioxygenase [Actinophytocola xinjiangensis]